SDEYSSGPLLKKHSDINRYKNFKDSMFELSGDLFSKRELLKTYGSHPSYLPHILLSTSIVVDETIRIITKYTTESLSHTCYGFDPCDFKVKKYEWK
ncbi:MAG: hypothetical protein Q4Q17_04175, partial [Tissierellia bacterium]|nr:hypothetical protein [Tissierellia bacterium]